MKIHYLSIFWILLFSTAALAADDFCFDCHGTQEGTSVKFKSDAHFANALSCADCHGGDPAINDMDKAKSAQAGFRIRVQRQDVPLFCAGCHSNFKFMAKYKDALPTNQLALYTRSVHGAKLAAGKTESAQCVDCHGIHDIKAGSDKSFPTNRANVSTTCGNCHAETLAVFRQNRTHFGRTTCVTCHGGHDTAQATTDLLTKPDQGCGTCHRPNSRQAQTAAQIAAILTNLQDAGPASKDAMAKARQAAHSFNVAAVRRAAENPATAPAPVEPARTPAPGRGRDAERD